MIKLVQYQLHAALEGRLEVDVEGLIDHKLDVDDVALLLGVQRSTVMRWTNTGKRGIVLPVLRLQNPDRPHPLLAFRLSAVEEFAYQLGITPDYRALDDKLQRAYKVGVYAPADSPRYGYLYPVEPVVEPPRIPVHVPDVAPVLDDDQMFRVHPNMTDPDLIPGEE